MHPQGPGETSIHLRKARRGEQSSLEWIIERFSPVLRAQASYRLGGAADGLTTPEDLVADTWCVALGRLSSLEIDGRRETPAVLKFLSSTLVYQYNNLARKRLRRGRLHEARSMSGLQEFTAGIVTQALRRERSTAVETAMAALEPKDREIVILRGIEQIPNAVAATILGEDPNSVSHRFRRALEKLRRAIPGSLFDDIEAEEESEG